MLSWFVIAFPYPAAVSSSGNSFSDWTILDGKGNIVNLTASSYSNAKTRLGGDEGQGSRVLISLRRRENQALKP